MSLYSVGVKNNDKVHALLGLVVAEYVEKHTSGAVNIHIRQFVQFLPCKNNIIAVNKEIGLLRYEGAFLPFVGPCGFL